MFTPSARPHTTRSGGRLAWWLGVIFDLPVPVATLPSHNSPVPYESGESARNKGHRSIGRYTLHVTHVRLDRSTSRSATTCSCSSRSTLEPSSPPAEWQSLKRRPASKPSRQLPLPCVAAELTSQSETDDPRWLLHKAETETIRPARTDLGRSFNVVPRIHQPSNTFLRCQQLAAHLSALQRCKPRCQCQASGQSTEEGISVGRG